MSNDNQPRDHEFDGIQEYDNDLPRWWVWLFVITIVFSVGYFVWYHSDLFPSKDLIAHFDEDLAATRAAAAVAAAVAESQATAGTSGQTGDGGIAAGKDVFSTNCAPCHGAEGQGIVGPNLTDDFWISGATKADVERIIGKGSLEKGMPGWGEILGVAKVHQLVAYVVSIQGTQPANPKPPQGAAGKLQ